MYVYIYTLYVYIPTESHEYLQHLSPHASIIPIALGAPGANGVFGQIGAEAHELRQRDGQLPSNGPCHVETWRGLGCMGGVQK